jgi:glutaredoxin-like YruB-family protein
MKVIIYSTSTCPWCDVAKDFFKKNKVAFQEINVEKDKKAAAEIMKKSGGAVPVIEIDGKMIIGFNETEIKKALKLK